jgi:hypothetical protein
VSTFDDMAARTRGRIEHLESERAKLEAEWRQIPRYAGAALLAIPAGLVWGWPAVVIVLVATLGLLVTAAYLLGVRRAGTIAELRDLRRELRIFEAEAAR